MIQGQKYHGVRTAGLARHGIAGRGESREQDLFRRKLASKFPH
jgi:hypothetical protein